MYLLQALIIFAVVGSNIHLQETQELGPRNSSSTATQMHSASVARSMARMSASVTG